MDDNSKYALFVLSLSGGISGNAVVPASRPNLRNALNALNIIMASILSGRVIANAVYISRMDLSELQVLAGVLMSSFFCLQIVLNLWLFVYASHTKKWPENYHRLFNEICGNLMKARVDLNVKKERRNQIIILVVNLSACAFNFGFVIVDSMTFASADFIFGNRLQNHTYTGSDVELHSIKAFGVLTNCLMLVLYHTQAGLFISKAYQMWHVFTQYNLSLKQTLLQSPNDFRSQIAGQRKLHTELCSLVQLGDETFCGFLFVSTTCGFLTMMVALYTLSKDPSDYSVTGLIALSFWIFLSALCTFICVFFSHKIYMQVRTNQLALRKCK